MKLRVQYINKPYKDKVYTYPFIVQSYRNEEGKPRTKIIQNLSHLPKNAVDALDVALRGEEEVKFVPLGSIHYHGSVPLGDTWAAFRVLEDLGVTRALEVLPRAQQVVIIASIIDRVINPKPYSKRALGNTFEDSILKRILSFEDTIPFCKWYQALESLYQHQTKIQKVLFNESVEKVFLYDITSSYFEGKCCPLAAFGYNRDGKKGKRQIVIGLLTTSTGRPVAVRVFEGNTADQSTVINQIKELKEEFGIKEVIFVGDRGMITTKRIEEIETGYEWVKYITAIKRKEMMELVKDENYPVQISLFDQMNLTELVVDGKRYILCHNPYRKEEDVNTRLYLLEKTKVKLESILTRVNKGRLKNKDKIAKKLYKWIDRWSMEKFFITEYDEVYFRYKLDEEKINRYSALDGCYVIVSNVAQEEMGKEEIVNRYRDLKYVEQAFRMMKTTDLLVRPIRHWNPERVKGHVFMCMLAYLVTWEAKNRLVDILERDQTKQCEGNSLREVWDSLAHINIGFIEAGGNKIEQVSDINKYQKKVLKMLNAQINKKALIRLSLRN